MRLIDSEKLIKKNCEDMYFNNDFMSCAVLSAFNKMLMNEPEIREINIAATAKHGKWTADKTNEPTKFFSCSECKGLIQIGKYAYKCYYNYCPNCGAKMDVNPE